MNLIEKYHLKVGDKIKIRANEKTDNRDLIGMIGEIQDDCFYVHNDTHYGNQGNIPPSKYRYSWVINNDDKNYDGNIVNGNINIRELNKILCSKKATE